MAKRFEKYQIDLLRSEFEQSEHLTKQKKIHLAKVTGLDMEQIASWFNRKRARKRAKESMGELQRINTELERTIQERQERETRLQNELQERRRRILALEEENQHLQGSLTNMETDFDAIISWIVGYP